jgi:hypothetical protein
VKVMLRTFVEPDMVAELNPDAVIVATGSTPRRDGFQVVRPAHQLRGADLPHVYTSWDVLGFGGRAQVGSNAVVYDDTGGYELICVCETLLEAGASVTLVSHFERFPGHLAGSTLHSDMSAGPARERLLAHERFQFISDSYLVEITESDVEIRLIHPTATRTRRLPADTIAFIGYNHPNRDLADALEGGPPTYVVGDAAGSRSLRSAIKDATSLARSLIAAPVGA